MKIFTAAKKKFGWVLDICKKGPGWIVVVTWGLIILPYSYPAARIAARREWMAARTRRLRWKADHLKDFDPTNPEYTTLWHDEFSAENNYLMYCWFPGTQSTTTEYRLERIPRP